MHIDMYIYIYTELHMCLHACSLALVISLSVGRAIPTDSLRLAARCVLLVDEKWAYQRSPDLDQHAQFQTHR